MMTKKQKVQYVVDELEKLYPETPVPLDHIDAYTLLIAVLLSAQCTDARVNTITPILFAKTLDENTRAKETTKILNNFFIVNFSSLFM